jgi:hypothetical protein
MFFLTIYNAVTIPYRLTFWSSPVELSIDVSINVALDAVSDLCFFVEIFLALRTGFVDNGVLVLDRRRVWQRYKRGWFLVDLITAVPFDLLQLIFGRVVPAVRIPKLLRILQVVHHYNRIEESMASVSLQFRLCKLLFYTLLLSHFTACVKYIIMSVILCSCSLLLCDAMYSLHDHVRANCCYAMLCTLCT